MQMYFLRKYECEMGVNLQWVSIWNKLCGMGFLYAMGIYLQAVLMCNGYCWAMVIVDHSILVCNAYGNVMCIDTAGV